MLNVIYAESRNIIHYAECHYAKCCGANLRGNDENFVKIVSHIFFQFLTIFLSFLGELKISVTTLIRTSETQHNGITYKTHYFTSTTKCRYDKCHYAECHYAECHYTECHGTRKCVTFVDNHLKILIFKIFNIFCLKFPHIFQLSRFEKSKFLIS